MLLHLETATNVCAVALSDLEGRVVAHQVLSPTLSHASVLTVLIESVLQTANVTPQQLSAIALSDGPGSYTGLRVGAATAKGLCYALDIPLIAVSTLEAMAHAAAQNVENEAFIAPMIDARRMEVYTAVFQKNAQGHLERRSEDAPLIIDETAFAAWRENPNSRFLLLGNGAEKCQMVLTAPTFLYADIFCDALHLVPLAVEKWQQKIFVDIAYHTPNYLKPPNITTAKNVF
jgi:tRNA threonylcarbamoyladenosine biosynthesis protein TsaB